MMMVMVKMMKIMMMMVIIIIMTMLALIVSKGVLLCFVFFVVDYHFAILHLWLYLRA